MLIPRHLRYDWDNPGSADNDHLIFARGHASPLLYAVLKAVGAICDDELMGGDRPGLPTAMPPWAEVATGSLGRGLSDGVGIALTGKYLDRRPYRVWVLCGDGELVEDSLWAALDKAVRYRLANFVAIVDVDQRGGDLCAHVRRAEALGARVVTIDGHDLVAIDDALSAAAKPADGRPTVISRQDRPGEGLCCGRERPGPAPLTRRSGQGHRGARR